MKPRSPASADSGSVTCRLVMVVSPSVFLSRITRPGMMGVLVAAVRADTATQPSSVRNTAVPVSVTGSNATGERGERRRLRQEDVTRPVGQHVAAPVDRVAEGVAAEEVHGVVLRAPLAGDEHVVVVLVVGEQFGVVVALHVGEHPTDRLELLDELLTALGLD